ncbi:MAG: hypothetical protein OXG15_04550 [Gammaproteobacteria bacterium]|nr:hypothetical protein [Gammaproteobacteria bacterium]
MRYGQNVKHFIGKSRVLMTYDLHQAHVRDHASNPLPTLGAIAEQAEVKIAT